jgi:transposase InsO family protein
MNLHSKARICPASRELLARRMDLAAWSADQAAEALGISTRTVFKWRGRYRAEGEPGLHDRSSRPKSMPFRTSAGREGLVMLLRCSRLTGRQIAARLRMPRSTVAAILKRLGLARLKNLEHVAPVIRYERERPGELLHLDIKKLGRIAKVGHRITGDRRDTSRGAGWEYVHVAIDDASRLAYVEVLANEQAETTAGFLRRALIFFRRNGIRRFERVMTDNGSAYVSHLFAHLCQQQGIRHLRTRPYTPKTNGKAERFIQTLIREWAYARAYHSSRARTAALPRWLTYYNLRRPHGSLNHEPPISRV